MNSYSPRTPSGQSPAYYDDYADYRMSSETPSPMHGRPTWVDRTPVRPSTRASTHSRHSSYSTQSSFSPRPPKDSPRYNSSGQYATVDVSSQDFSSSRPPKSHRPAKHNRRSSFTHVRSSTPYGESDDEIIEAFGETFVLPAQSRSKGRRYSTYIPDYDGVRYTNHGHFSQESPYSGHDRVYSREPSYDMPTRPIAQPRAPTAKPGHQRRSSTTMPMPQRSSTARPGHHGTSRAAKPATAPATATEADAKRHKIPAGFSLKNWDPREEPILLLGSVFDANSLGKWIYDWTVYNVGSRGPIAEMAGELWLLLLELTEKTNRAINIGLKVRKTDKREVVNDYLDSSERLLETLRLLLKNCEAPMLNVDAEKRKKQAALGKSAGIEFVDTLFGRDRELMRTEKFMQKLRTWSMRFEANVTPILENPTA